MHKEIVNSIVASLEVFRWLSFHAGGIGDNNDVVNGREWSVNTGINEEQLGMVIMWSLIMSLIIKEYDRSNNKMI